MFEILEFASLANCSGLLLLQLLLELPSNGAAPPTLYTDALELAFVFGGALLAIIVILKDPIYPKSKTLGKKDKPTES